MKFNILVLTFTYQECDREFNKFIKANKESIKEIKPCNKLIYFKDGTHILFKNINASAEHLKGITDVHQIFITDKVNHDVKYCGVLEYLTYCSLNRLVPEEFAVQVLED